jgi:hypothetical protein
MGELQGGGHSYAHDKEKKYNPVQINGNGG